MALSWNEIKNRAINFSKEWETEEKEHAESQSFWNDFFNIFGISRKRVASFEEPVKKLGEKRGRIDLFWKGTLLVEHKSRGKDLDKAYTQALDYFPGLKEAELPKYILISDFEIFPSFDLSIPEFPLYFSTLSALTLAESEDNPISSLLCAVPKTKCSGLPLDTGNKTCK